MSKTHRAIESSTPESPGLLTPPPLPSPFGLHSSTSTGKQHLHIHMVALEVAPHASRLFPRPSRLFPHASRLFPRDGPLVLCEGSSTASHFAKVPSRQSLCSDARVPSEVQSTWGVVEAARDVGVTYKLWPSCRSSGSAFSFVMFRPCAAQART